MLSVEIVTYVVFVQSWRILFGYPVGVEWRDEVVRNGFFDG
jgi:hypothetical protein